MFGWDCHRWLVPGALNQTGLVDWDVPDCVALCAPDWSVVLGDCECEVGVWRDDVEVQIDV